MDETVGKTVSFKMRNKKAGVNELELRKKGGRISTWFNIRE